jgi:hypothetical protein
MHKITDAVVAVGITFGPLFATNIAGMGRGGSTVTIGVGLLMAALFLMWTRMREMQKEIASLRQAAEPR